MPHDKTRLFTSQMTVYCIAVYGVLADKKHVKTMQYAVFYLTNRMRQLHIFAEYSATYCMTDIYKCTQNLQYFQQNILLFRILHSQSLNKIQDDTCLNKITTNVYLYTKRLGHHGIHCLLRRSLPQCQHGPRPSHYPHFYEKSHAKKPPCRFFAYICHTLSRCRQRRNI